MRIDFFKNLIFSGRGSSALFALLKALDLKGSEVMLPVNVCEIIYPIVKNSGYLPCFYDVDSVSGNTNLNLIKSKFTNNQKVLLLVHNFGVPVEDIFEIKNWCKRNNVFLIEDVCNSLGAKYKGKYLGKIGDASILSFGYAKIIENNLGGGCFVKDKQLRDRTLKIVDEFDVYNDLHFQKNLHFQTLIQQKRKGQLNDYSYEELYDEYFLFLLYKISDNEILKIKNKLLKLNSITNFRVNTASLYRENLDERIFRISHLKDQTYWRFNILVDSDLRNTLLDVLHKNGSYSSKWYPPINGFFECKQKDEKFEGAICFSEQVINLLLYEKNHLSSLFKTIELINKFVDIES